jgi:uncharacterized protein YodC (DUF2158 family)
MTTTKTWETRALVVLKSGGPLMTVESKYAHSDDGYYCTWFDKAGKRYQEIFKANALEEGKKDEGNKITVNIV